MSFFAKLSGFLSPKRALPSVPEGVRIYAVGDIHGCAEELERLHQQIEADAATFDEHKSIIYLGDYVDRGRESRRVIERLLQGPPPGFNARYLKGNHEAELLAFLQDSARYRAWRAYGAPETLLSYGVRPPLFDDPEKFEEARLALAAAIPATHQQFLHSLELQCVIGDYAFVHAGIRPGLATEDQVEQDVLWIRDEFVNCNLEHSKVIVHGHTPSAQPLSRHNRIGVDTGAYATGILSCVVLEGASRRFLQTARLRSKWIG